MYKYMIILPLIKESALLFQYQRPKATINNKKYLIATWQDLSNTLTYGGQILEATLTGMDTRLLETLPTIQKILNKQDYITVKDLMKEIHKSQS
ncbi:MAG: hypothetical protein ACXVZU_00460, partial [Methanobacteriaceae archaeon]